MSYLTGKHIPRRKFIRGMGAAVALPFMESMVPAGPQGKGAAFGTERTRLVCIEEVHGLPGCNQWGATQFLFAPSTTGKDFEIVPKSALVSLKPFQDYPTIVSNTDARMAEALAPPEVGGDHFRSSSVFLTQCHPKQTQGSDIYVGTSLDQIYAKQFGQDTPIPSVQFCIENLDQAGGCAYNYSCAYTDSISWSAPNQPLPMIRDPRVAFDMLFGAGGSPEERAERRATRRSILDSILREMSDLRKDLGAADRNRLDAYLDNIREVERRIQLVEKQNSTGAPRELPGAPAGVPDSFSEHMKLMFDLQVLAMESDLTRVISFKTGRDADNRVFPESGSNKPFHPTSHHGNNQEKILEFNKICQYRVSMLPYFLEKLKNSKEGDASLLDKAMVLWGSPMADANIHNHRRCPLMFLGRANGLLAGNLHLKAPEGTPMANVMLAVLHMLGVDNVETFGDSTGEFALSSPAKQA
jgi:Protein of unknown function (DUF1552)